MVYDPRQLGQEQEEIEVNYTEKRAKQIAFREKLEKKARQMEAEAQRRKKEQKK